VLGLLVDPSDAQFQARLVELRSRREDRNRRMLVRLAELGCPLTLEDVQAQADSPCSPGSILPRPSPPVVLCAGRPRPSSDSSATTARASCPGRTEPIGSRPLGPRSRRRARGRPSRPFRQGGFPGMKPWRTSSVRAWRASRGTMASTARPSRSTSWPWPASRHGRHRRQRLPRRPQNGLRLGRGRGASRSRMISWNTWKRSKDSVLTIRFERAFQCFWTICQVSIGWRRRGIHVQ